MNFHFSGVIKVMKSLPEDRKVLRAYGDVTCETNVKDDLKKKHLEFNEVS